MRYFYRGVIVGILLLLLCCYKSVVTKDSDIYSVQINEPVQTSWQDNFSLSYNASPYSHNFSYDIDKPFTGLDLVRAYIHDTRFCQWRYDLTSQQVHRLLTLSYACIVTELLKLDHLSSRGIAELWRLYKGGCNRQGKIKKCEQELFAKLQQRAEDYHQKVQEQERHSKQEQEKQRRQKFIQEQHEQVSQELAWLDVSDELYELRDMALEQSKTEGYQQYKQSYDLDAQVQGYLQSKQINYRDYTKCFGTPLQQQYHQEMCDVIKELAEQELHYKHKAHLFDHSLNFVQATGQANNKAYLSVAGVLSWTARQLLELGKDIYHRPIEYGQAVVSGLYESGKDAIHMLSRPDLTLYGLGQMIYFFLETSAMLEAVGSYPCKETQEVYQQRVSQIHETLSGLQQEFIDLAGPGKLKAITKFGADFYIPVKITHACGYLLSGPCSRVRGAQTLEGVVSIMSDEFGLAEAFEELVAKAEQLEPAIEQGVVKQANVEFMQAEKIVGRGGTVFNKKIHPHHLNKYPESKNSLHHLFRAKEGHISGTPANKKMILDMVQQEKYCLGEVKGVIWYGKINEAGEQVWACVWQESLEIRNCGINKTPRQWDKDRGLNILRYSKGQKNYEK